MQIFAYDKRRESISAAQAERKINYFCPECQGIVRVRGGNHRRRHFFHCQEATDCGLGKKSKLHISTQLALQKMLLPYTSFLESPFPTIGRIADCLVPELNLNFEIQCSPIDPEEVEARIRDYASCGLTTIWVLHEKTFNKKWLHPAEICLKNYPHYFTNINEKGEGQVYDQFSVEENNLRTGRSRPFSVTLSQPLYHKTKSFLDVRPLWPLSFAGDLLNAVAGEEEIKRLKKLLRKKPSPFIQEWKKLGRYLGKKLF